MPLAEILSIVGALCAPAFFLIFALSALGAPLLALVCLLAAQLRSTMHLEAYARRLLRLALSCTVPSLLVLFGSLGLLAWRADWVADWLLAAPLLPSLFGVVLLAFCASLLTVRLSRPSQRHRRQDSPVSQAALLSLLALCIFWLAAEFFGSLGEQAQAVLRAPSEGGIGVARLVAPDATGPLQPAWTALAAAVVIAMASAGAMSLEYLLALRDREPFGHEAQAHMLRLSARTTLRTGLLAGTFLPALWNRLPAMPSLPGAEDWAQALLAASGLACLLLCLAAGLVARSKRPWTHALLIHGCLLALWGGLAALLSLCFLAFYGN